MVRIPYLRARLAAAALLTTTAAVPAAAQTWGFEDGSLGPWTATGDAFAMQPTFGNNVAPRRPGESPGNDGNYWLGTYESHRTPSAPIGMTQGDGPQGTLTSPPFIIEGQSVAFLIGGGRDIDREHVALLVRQEPGMPPPGRPDIVQHFPDGDYIAFEKATGRDDEHMMRTIWPTDRWIGLTARFQIVDRSSEPWGHINADSFQFSWVAPLGRAVPVNDRGGLGTAVPVNPNQPVVAYPVGGGSVVVSPPQGGGAMAPAQPVYVPPAGSNAAGGGGVVVAQPAPGGGGMTATDPGGPRLPGTGPQRFRLVASSFHVDHQTADDVLERDGRGDEIYVRGDVFEYRNFGHFSRHDVVQSGVFGERTEFHAGSGRPGPLAAGDQIGGLVTNDSYPARGDNWSGTPARNPRDLPMVLWEGTLERGDAVLIVPSLWEWDDSGTSRAEADWSRAIDAQGSGLQLGGIRAVGAGLQTGPTFPNDGNISTDLLAPLNIFDDGNRPIGAQIHGGELRTGPAGMRAPAIVFRYDDIDRAANRMSMFSARIQNEDGTVTSAEYPGPLGGFSLRFVDPTELEGDYTLFLRLEQLP